jgi:hypothetical protein
MKSFLMSFSKSRLDVSEFSVFSKPRNIVNGHLKLESVSREKNSFFVVLHGCDFGKLCMNVDMMIRFDSFLPMRPRDNGYVVAVFGASKMYCIL